MNVQHKNRNSNHDSKRVKLRARLPSTQNLSDPPSPYQLQLYTVYLHHNVELGTRSEVTR